MLQEYVKLALYSIPTAYQPPLLDLQEINVSHRPAKTSVVMVDGVALNQNTGNYAK